jgi:hypothetical protein
MAPKSTTSTEPGKSFYFPGPNAQETEGVQLIISAILRALGMEADTFQAKEAHKPQDGK